jgi:hypothetical protein
MLSSFSTDGSSSRKSRRQNQRRAAPRPEEQAVGGFSRSAASWIEGFVEDVLAEPRQCSEIGQLSAFAARVKDLREAAVKLQGLPPAPVAGVALAPFLYDNQAALQTGGVKHVGKPKSLDAQMAAELEARLQSAVRGVGGLTKTRKPARWAATCTAAPAVARESPTFGPRAAMTAGCSAIRSRAAWCSGCVMIAKTVRSLDGARPGSYKEHRDVCMAAAAATAALEAVTPAKRKRSASLASITPPSTARARSGDVSTRTSTQTEVHGDERVPKSP